MTRHYVLNSSSLSSVLAKQTESPLRYSDTAGALHPTLLKEVTFGPLKAASVHVQSLLNAAMLLHNMKKYIPAIQM